MPPIMAKESTVRIQTSVIASSHAYQPPTLSSKKDPVSNHFRVTINNEMDETCSDPVIAMPSTVLSLRHCRGSRQVVVGPPVVPQQSRSRLHSAAPDQPGAVNRHSLGGGPAAASIEDEIADPILPRKETLESPVTRDVADVV